MVNAALFLGVMALVGCGTDRRGRPDATIGDAASDLTLGDLGDRQNDREQADHANAESGTDGSFDSDAGLCARATACALCLSAQPEAHLCSTRWNECAAISACANAVPTLLNCLCDASTVDDRWSCNGAFGTSEMSGVAFSLTYCVGVDACFAQCLE